MEKSHEKHAKKPRTELRQKEYQVSDDTWIKYILNQGSHGTLASVYEGQPYITPILYLYDEADQAIYFHGARTGKLRANLHYNPAIAFNVLEFGKILPHQDASEFNVAYKSVTVFGCAQIVEDQTKSEAILYRLLEKYAPQLEPGKDFHAIQPKELKTTAVYQICIQDWTGKQQMESREALDSFDYIPPKTSPR